MTFLHPKILKLSILGIGLASLFSSPGFAEEASLTIYSSRQEQLIKPLLDAYTKETGTTIKLHTGKPAPLIQQIKSEGENTPADILMTVDVGNLWLASEEGLFAKTNSSILRKNIPSHLRDQSNQWFGLSIRARTIFYNPTKVKGEELSTYEDLASEKWKNRLCLRTSKKVYNQSLVAGLVAHNGEKQTEKVVRSWVDNLATNVFSNDTELLKAIDAGQCHVGIANTYYFGRLVKANPNMNVKVFWPNQGDHGTHVNISGAGIVKASQNKKEAKAFLEWLSQGEAQRIFAALNMEYPVNPQVQAAPLVKSWGEFEQDLVSLTRVGKLQTKAVRLMERARYK